MHETEYFKDVILDVANRSGISDEIIEKDYYVTMILKRLSEMNTDIVFKGGTSLSKAFHVIDRFSEDVDITFTEHIGAGKRKKLKYNILKPISEELGMPILNWNEIESDRDYNRYDFGYKSISGEESPEPPKVIVETALMSYSFPTEIKEITSIVYDYLHESDKSVMEEYELLPFQMKVQALERTLIDKMFAICDYYMLKNESRNSRHLYDIYKIHPLIHEDEGFKSLIGEVREHRSKMSVKIAPSAQPDVDVISQVQSLCEEDFYRKDYEDKTSKLIYDDINYDTVIEYYKELMERFF